jgi:galactose mutarotase-like enzyme
LACAIDGRWSYEGLRCIRLENEHLAVDVLPELGGKIYRLIDKARDLDVLWKSPRVRPHRAELHSNFDDHWPGGWDEAFPGGAPSPNRHGDQLPYMGELWTQDWRWEIAEANPKRVELVLGVTTPITPARWERRITLTSGEPILRVHYRLENVGYMPFDFNWGIHPVQPAAAGTRIDLPAGRVEVANEWGGGTIGKEGDAYEWPWLGKYDVRQVLGPETLSYALHFVTELKAGWVALTDPRAERGFGMVFDKSIFSVLWLWLVYGGWRSYQQLIIEPWTGYPSRLEDAVAAGRARVLDPGQTLETDVSAILYSGVKSVSALFADGRVEP